jgi:26S proteasome regulatory subunit T5
VELEKLKPGELVGVHKESFLILDLLPPEYDARVKAMEVDERPTEDYGDIGLVLSLVFCCFFLDLWFNVSNVFFLLVFHWISGLEKEINELKEAVVLPLTHKDLFEEIGIQAPKGVLLYGPPGTGKTLMARACAAQTKSTFLKLAGPQLVQVC